MDFCTNFGLGNCANSVANDFVNKREGNSQFSPHQKAQMDAVAAAAAFLLSIPIANENAAQKNNGSGGECCTSSQETTMSSSSSASLPASASSAFLFTANEEEENNKQQAEKRHSPPQPPISQKGNNWIHLGTFQTEEEMHHVRNKEKVSKRRTEQLKTGVKIRYRCNTWKRTKCGFQMFSFYNAQTGFSDLYECGEHDHSGRRKLEYELNGQRRRKPMIANSSNNDNNKFEKKNIAAAGRNSRTAEKKEQIANTNHRQPPMMKQPQTATTMTTALDLVAQLFDMRTSSSGMGSDCETATRTTTAFCDENTKCVNGKAAATKQTNNSIIAANNNNNAMNVNSSSSNFLYPLIAASALLHQQQQQQQQQSTYFSLSDQGKFDKVCEIASEFGMDFVPDCNNPGYYLVRHNCKTVLTLIESHEMFTLITEVGAQQWLKADWEQFLWAIRGRFAFLKKCAQ